MTCTTMRPAGVSVSRPACARAGLSQLVQRREGVEHGPVQTGDGEGVVAAGSASHILEDANGSELVQSLALLGQGIGWPGGRRHGRSPRGRRPRAGFIVRALVRGWVV